jgi:tRNA G18 (ribose-2'-O)-methylase SpoU
VRDSRVTLVGDGIENPHNALAMIEIAATLGAACTFVDRKELKDGLQTVYPEAGPLSSIDLQTMSATYEPVVACDTLPHAVDLFGVKLARGTRPALVVGNERLGLTHSIQKLAHQRVRIPMAGRAIDSLNVAAAAAVALYYLRRGSGPMQMRSDPAAHRPDLLLMSPRDHAELGCAIRSAAALGWRRLLIEDRAAVWFSAERRLRAEGRAAACQSKNSIVVFPVESERNYAYAEAVVVSASPRPGSMPLQRANLARGGQQLIVVPDPCARLARAVRFAHLDVPDHTVPLRYRALASISMAEVAR